MPHWLEQALGTLLVLAVLLDVFLTVLYARMGTGFLSYRLGRITWLLFRGLAKPFGPRSGDVLSPSAGRRLSCSSSWSGRPR